MKQKIMEKESEQKVAKLQDEIQSSHQKAASDSEYYRIMREAEANQKRLTPEFIEYTRIVSMSNNTKVFLGAKSPTCYSQMQSPRHNIDCNKEKFTGKSVSMI